jgi:hypothetical protein
MGNYLTTAGRDRQYDFDLIASLGMSIRSPPHAPHPPSVPHDIRGSGTDLGGLKEKNQAVPIQ